jgi:A/G-specific adenine glycosylase
VRGLILAALRAVAGPLPVADIEELWPDAVQRGRAIDGLLTDGLVVGTPRTGYELPRG